MKEIVPCRDGFGFSEGGIDSGYRWSLVVATVEDKWVGFEDSRRLVYLDWTTPSSKEQWREGGGRSQNISRGFGLGERKGVLVWVREMGFWFV